MLWSCSDLDFSWSPKDPLLKTVELKICPPTNWKKLEMASALVASPPVVLGPAGMEQRRNERYI